MDRYIRAQPAEARRLLEELRACIREAAPNVIELMNYDIPAFALVEGGKREQQVMIAGYRGHVGFYPHPEVIKEFADRLTGYKSSKGSVQFPLNAPLPRELVIEMVRHRQSQLRE